jgi:hypothetical protein
LKTVEGNTSGGSNPPFSANQNELHNFIRLFLFQNICKLVSKSVWK